MRVKKIALVWVLVVGLLAVAVQANLDPPFPPPPPPPPTKQPWKSGETTVTLSQDGTLRISGNGAMEDYQFGWHGRKYPPWWSAKWHNTAPSVITVVIEEGVTHVGTNAFEGYIGTIQSITVAADNAHYSSEDGVLFNKNKTALIFYPNGKQRNNYTIPNSVTSIGKVAFLACTSLTSITIPNSVTSIGESAFSSCISLTSIAIPNSVTSIGESAFMYCHRLASFTIGNSVTDIEENTFSLCYSLTSIAIPNSVTTIGDMAFDDCRSLASVTIGNGVTSIGDWAFRDCENLTSVTIGKSVAFIGSWAFENCSILESVTILNPQPPKFYYKIFEPHPCIYVPAKSYLTYRAAKGWDEFECIKEIEEENVGNKITVYLIVTLVLSATVLAIFIIIRKSRIKQEKERQ